MWWYMLYLQKMSSLLWFCVAKTHFWPLLNNITQQQIVTCSHLVRYWIGDTNLGSRFETLLIVNVCSVKLKICVWSSHHLESSKLVVLLILSFKWIFTAWDGVLISLDRHYFMTQLYWWVWTSITARLQLSSQSSWCLSAEFSSGRPYSPAVVPPSILCSLVTFFPPEQLDINSQRCLHHK